MDNETVNQQLIQQIKVIQERVSNATSQFELESIIINGLNGLLQTLTTSK